MTPGILRARVLPPSLLSARGAWFLIERNAVAYRHAWIILISGFFEPVFYLFSLGVGMGPLVGDVTVDGHTVGYATFVAPALLAASAMNGSVYESTINIFSKLKFAQTYDAVLATPVRPLDIAIGEITWSQLRGLAYAAVFLAIMAAMGTVPSWWGLLGLPAAVLIGFAFAGIGMALTTYMKTWQHFEFITIAMLPLFLFSATFFPAEVLPAQVRPLLWLSPLYHGVELLRALTLGHLHWSVLVHAAVLLVLAVAGVAVAARRIGRLLLQ